MPSSALRGYYFRVVPSPEHGRNNARRSCARRGWAGRMSRGERPLMTKAGREAIKMSRLISNRHGRRRQCRATHVVKNKKHRGGAKTLAHIRVRTVLFRASSEIYTRPSRPCTRLALYLEITSRSSRFNFARNATTLAQ